MCGTEHYLSDLEVPGLKVAEHSFEMNGRESLGQIVFRPNIQIWLLIILLNARGNLGKFISKYMVRLC